MNKEKMIQFIAKEENRPVEEVENIFVGKSAKFVEPIYIKMRMLSMEK